MKKNLLRVFCLVLVLTMVLGVIPAMAANDVTVYVSVSDQGVPAVTKDGKPAVQLAVKVPAGSAVEEAIIAAHAAYCPEGAAGWEMGESDWGPAMMKIWGKYDGVGAWYQNGVMPMDNVKNMTVSDSDYIDLVLYGPDWSDSYACFDVRIAAVAAGESLTLTLTHDVFDENWVPAPVALADAKVTLADGTLLGTTDAEGKVKISFSAAGTYVVTASSADTVITAPSCVVTVKDAGYKMYTVKAGDTLWSIAKATLGSGFRWGELYYLNADLLKSPRMIYVGQTLRIPA
jgi:nucleoid-associated protein YgaU